MKAYKKVRSCNEHNILTEEYINIKNKLRIAFTNNRKKLYAFTICFFTPCYDNSGITHILEHCIVKGIDDDYYSSIEKIRVKSKERDEVRFALYKDTFKMQRQFIPRSLDLTEKQLLELIRKAIEGKLKIRMVKL